MFACLISWVSVKNVYEYENVYYLHAQTNINPADNQQVATNSYKQFVCYF